MKTRSNLMRCTVAVILAGFMGSAIAIDRYITIAGIVAVWETQMNYSEDWESEFTEALNNATDQQLLEIENATNYDAVRAILQGRSVPVELEGVTSTEALGDLNADLVFTPVVPCRFFDTRFDSDTGSIGHTSGSTATIRSYQVYGDATTIQGQGGSVACPAPNGEPVGISANFTAAPLASPSTGKGNIRAYPFGGSLPSVSLVNYEAGTNIANAAIVATCFMCGSDLSVATQFHSSASIGDVMGYFYPAILSPEQGTYTRDGTVGSYTTSNERYVIESSSATVGVVQPIDHVIFTRLCQDLDGCDLTVAMVNWDSQQAVASRNYKLFYSMLPGLSGDFWWRIANNDFMGVDGNGIRTEFIAFDCFFTDAETYLGTPNNRADNGPGFALLNAAGGDWSDATVVCRIVIED